MRGGDIQRKREVGNPDLPIRKTLRNIPDLLNVNDFKNTIHLTEIKKESFSNIFFITVRGNLLYLKI